MAEGFEKFLEEEEGIKTPQGDEGGAKDESGTIEVSLEDDGEKGGRKDDEGPPPNSPRWKEIYWKAKEGERKMQENEELRKQLEKNEALIRQMQEHNRKLAESIEKVSEATIKVVEKGQVEDRTKTIKEEIASLRERRKEALENDNYDLADDITEEILDLKLQLKEVEKSKGKESGEKKEKPKEETDPSFDPTPYEQFVNSSPWFIEDPIMRAAAIEVDNILSSDPVWAVKSDAERLAEVKKRVESRFQYQPKGNGSAVEGERRDTSPSGKTVKLTAEEVEVARALGLTPEQYAKQKAMLGS